MMFGRERRLEKRQRKLEEAVDDIELRVTTSEEGELKGVTPYAVVGMAILPETKRERSEDFVRRLGERGIAAVVYDGYTYRGDSADERDPFRLYATTLERFYESGEDRLQPPVRHALAIWAQTIDHREDLGGE